MSTLVASQVEAIAPRSLLSRPIGPPFTQKSLMLSMKGQWEPLIRNSTLRVRPQAPPLPKASKLTETVKVLYDYTPANKDEVSLVKGELMVLVARVDQGTEEQGWWRLRSVGGKNVREGLAPSNYVVVLPPPPKPNRPPPSRPAAATPEKESDPFTRADTIEAAITNLLFVIEAASLLGVHRRHLFVPEDLVALLPSQGDRVVQFIHELAQVAEENGGSDIGSASGRQVDAGKEIRMQRVPTRQMAALAKHVDDVVMLLAQRSTGPVGSVVARSGGLSRMRPWVKRVGFTEAEKSSGDWGGSTEPWIDEDGEQRDDACLARFAKASDSKRRAAAARELLFSQRDTCADLDAALETFVEPLEGMQITDESSSLFHNLVGIAESHREFLRLLEASLRPPVIFGRKMPSRHRRGSAKARDPRVDCWEALCAAVEGAFAYFEDGGFLPCMDDYVRNLSSEDGAFATLSRLRKESHTFADWLEESHRAPVLRGIDLGGFLIIPAQRLTYMARLCDILWGATTGSHPFRSGLTKARNYIHKVLGAISEAAEEATHARLMDVTSIMCEDGRLLREGPVRVVHSSGKMNQRHLFLFTDCVVIAVPRQWGGGLTRETTMMFNNMAVKNLVAADSHQFLLSSTKTSHQVVCSTDTAEEKQAWLGMIVTQYARHAQQQEGKSLKDGAPRARSQTTVQRPTKPLPKTPRARANTVLDLAEPPSVKAPARPPPKASHRRSRSMSDILLEAEVEDLLRTARAEARVPPASGGPPKVPLPALPIQEPETVLVGIHAESFPVGIPIKTSAPKKDEAKPAMMHSVDQDAWIGTVREQEPNGCAKCAALQAEIGKMTDRMKKVEASLVDLEAREREAASQRASLAAEFLEWRRVMNAKDTVLDDAVGAVSEFNSAEYEEVIVIEEGLKSL